MKRALSGQAFIWFVLRVQKPLSLFLHVCHTNLHFTNFGNICLWSNERKINSKTPKIIYQILYFKRADQMSTKQILNDIIFSNHTIQSYNSAVQKVLSQVIYFIQNMFYAVFPQCNEPSEASYAIPKNMFAYQLELIGKNLSKICFGKLSY